MSTDAGATQGNVYSADGRWWWDGQRWTPVEAAIQPAIAPPALDTPRTTGAGLAGSALALGIGAAVVGVVLWIFTFFYGPNKVDDVIVTILLVIGFILAQLAVVLGVRAASRPRRPAAIGAFTCGLTGMGLLVLFMVTVTIGF